LQASEEFYLGNCNLLLLRSRSIRDENKLPYIDVCDYPAGCIEIAMRGDEKYTTERPKERDGRQGTRGDIRRERSRRSSRRGGGEEETAFRFKP
jgi:hypothetical protein